MRKLIIAILCFSFFLSGCGRWNRIKLTPELAYTIKSGEEPGQVMLRYDNNDILNISFDIKIFNNNIYTIDNILNRIQKLDRNGDPKIYISDKKYFAKTKSDVEFAKFQFNVIKDIAVDSNSNIYIQNNISSSRTSNLNNNLKDGGLSPSYILIFSEKGVLSYTLGRSGSPDIPFNFINELKIDKKDRLFVISRSFDTWTIYRFVNRKSNFSVNFRDKDFSENSDDEKYSGKIEKIIVYNSGDAFLISVAYYNNIEFINRKIFSYSIESAKIDRTVMEISRPENELFELINDKNIYLWAIDNKNVRFKIANMEGSIINNVLMKFPDTTDSYNEIFIDNNGIFYSYHAGKNGIKIMEWH
jgi:hypothetical protein